MLRWLNSAPRQPPPCRQHLLPPCPPLRQRLGLHRLPPPSAHRQPREGLRSLHLPPCPPLLRNLGLHLLQFPPRSAHRQPPKGLHSLHLPPCRPLLFHRHLGLRPRLQLPPRRPLFRWPSLRQPPEGLHS